MGVPSGRDVGAAEEDPDVPNPAPKTGHTNLPSLAGFGRMARYPGEHREPTGEAGTEARYLTDDSGERVGVVLGAEEYRAIMEVYDRVAKASRAIGEAEGSSSESRLVFEARISEAQKELTGAARKLEAVHRDCPPR